MQVGSPVWHGGLSNQYCHRCSWNPIPDLGTPYSSGQPKKKKKISKYPNLKQLVFDLFSLNVDKPQRLEKQGNRFSLRIFYSLL